MSVIFTCTKDASDGVVVPITVLSMVPPSISTDANVPTLVMFGCDAVPNVPVIVVNVPASGVVAPITVLSIVPPLISTDAKVAVEVAVIWSVVMVPLTSNPVVGVVFPIPTFPSINIPLTGGLYCVI